MNPILIGPFSQIVTMQNLPLKGSIADEKLEIIEQGGILVKGDQILQVGHFDDLILDNPHTEVQHVKSDLVALPGFIDCHTHICFGGTRAMDYAARNNGKSYLEIAKEGGGIWSTVTQTRTAGIDTLVKNMHQRMDRLMTHGITTVEVKSGYGLSIDHEIMMLRAIQQAGQNHPMDIVPTCLAAHMVPKDFDGDETAYLAWIQEALVPIIQDENLCDRFDIFIEESAFSMAVAKSYLLQLQALGFQLTVHGDQFTTGGSQVAVEVGANSVDHLEASGPEEIARIAASDTVAVALPGASIGLGCAFTPARALLDAGASVAIASDWNPGSAPHGDLLTQAAILGTFQKLSAAEIFAGITLRAAHALRMDDRGVLTEGKKADIVCFPTNDFREILYKQGTLKPSLVYKNGVSKNISNS